MTKIDRSWRIKCANGKEMNQVWQVLKDAGEPMYAESPHYAELVVGSMGFKGMWLCIYKDDSANITFKEFMKIMGPVFDNSQSFSEPTAFDYTQTSITKASTKNEVEFIKMMKSEEKEDVQYIDNLLAYIDKPELIQHVDGRAVRAIHCFPNRDMILIVFETGRTTYYYKNGKYIDRDKRSSFILKPKEKKIVKGWTRKVINKDGTTFIAPLAYPTKEEFMTYLKNHYGSDKLGYGPWEEVITEVFDD